MNIKSKLKLWLAAAMVANAGIKLIQTPRNPGKSQRTPKTQADYEAMHAAELKRRRKAEKRALHSNTL